MIGTFLNAVIATTDQLPSPGGSNGTIILVALIGAVAGITGTGATLWRFRKLGDEEKKQMSRDAADKAVDALEKALERYEMDISKALARVELLERELESAQCEIDKLKASLTKMEGQNEELEAKLRTAQRRRDLVEIELDHARRRLGRLEDMYGRRYSDREGAARIPDTGERRRSADMSPDDAAMDADD